jgi:TrmH family RNA methyltransferase
VEQVTSRQNDLVRRFRELARDNRDGEAVLLDGAHLIEEALSTNVELEAVAFAAGAARGRLAPLVARCAASAARLVTVPDALLATISPVRSASPVVAIARLRLATVDAALSHPPQLVIFLDGVQDPGNVGAIIRAAEACGATAVVAGRGTADPLGWKALRGSMGSTFRLPVASTGSLADALQAARTAGLHLYAAVPRGGTPLARADLAQPVGVVLGGEGAGLPAETMTGTDEALSITMRAPVESLNVAIAAAVVLYEASRQRADVTVR